MGTIYVEVSAVNAFCKEWREMDVDEPDFCVE
jgi:hypothetical protein